MKCNKNPEPLASLEDADVGVGELVVAAAAEVAAAARPEQRLAVLEECGQEVGEERRDERVLLVEALRAEHRDPLCGAKTTARFDPEKMLRSLRNTMYTFYGANSTLLGSEIIKKVVLTVVEVGDVVDDHVGAGLRDVILAVEIRLLGEEARDGDGLRDDGALVL